MTIYIGTADWALGAEGASAFEADCLDLQRFAGLMDCVEINSSFYRSHRARVYERWAECTPSDFRFAVKCPKRISHGCRLEDAREPLKRFVDAAAALGPKWCVLLVQLPTSLVYDDRVAGRFFDQVHACFGGAIVCEPRHPSWFTHEAERLLRDVEVSRAAVDPPKWPEAVEPGGWTRALAMDHAPTLYCRWHGSPREYWSSYDDGWLRERALWLQAQSRDQPCWGVFGNTAGGKAVRNALRLKAMLRDEAGLSDACSGGRPTGWVCMSGRRAEAKPAVVVATAGWSIPAQAAGGFPAQGSQLERYAAVMKGVEINSSFYRPHRPQIYERWAASTPEQFRFAVKCPKQISHEARLEGAVELLARFAGEAAALGDKWAVLLVQLPPSLGFDARVAGRFFEQVHGVFQGGVVCEPRHAGWFTPEAEQVLRDSEVARAGVDPAKWPGAAEPGGWPGLRYFRWHGSPRIYWSPYEPEWLQARAEARPRHEPCWCVFDNTASGAALQDALKLQALL